MVGASCYNTFDIRFQSCDGLHFSAYSCRWLWSPASFRRVVLPQHNRRKRDRDLGRQAEPAGTFGSRFFLLVLDLSNRLIGVGTNCVLLPHAFATIYYDWNGF